MGTTLAAVLAVLTWAAARNVLDRERSVSTVVPVVAAVRFPGYSNRQE